MRKFWERNERVKGPAWKQWEGWGQKFAWVGGLDRERESSSVVPVGGVGSNDDPRIKKEKIGKLKVFCNVRIRIHRKGKRNQEGVLWNGGLKEKELRKKNCYFGWKKVSKEKREISRDMSGKKGQKIQASRKRNTLRGELEGENLRKKMSQKRKGTGADGAQDLCAGNRFLWGG